MRIHSPAVIEENHDDEDFSFSSSNLRLTSAKVAISPSSDIRLNSSIGWITTSSLAARRVFRIIFSLLFWYFIETIRTFPSLPF